MNIGLIAHNAKKKLMQNFCIAYRGILSKHELYATGTTGRLVEEVFLRREPNKAADIIKLKSGPLGGDQQMGALIASGHLDILIFFIDPMTTQPHDVDIKALERLCSVYNVVIACTRSTADFVISSHLFEEDYKPVTIDYANYLNRHV